MVVPTPVAVEDERVRTEPEFRFRVSVCPLPMVMDFTLYVPSTFKVAPLEVKVTVSEVVGREPAVQAEVELQFPPPELTATSAAFAQMVKQSTAEIAASVLICNFLIIVLFKLRS